MKTFVSKGMPTATQAVFRRAAEFADHVFDSSRDVPVSKLQLYAIMGWVFTEYKLMRAPLGIHGPTLEGYTWLFNERGATPAQALKLAKAVLARVAEQQNR